MMQPVPETLEDIVKYEPIEDMVEYKPLEEFMPKKAVEYVTPEISVIKLQMHKKLLLVGNYLIENIGGGDVQVNGMSLCVGESISVSGDILLYADCFPKVRLSKFGG